MSRKSHQTWVPLGVQNEIATLRHFLPSHAFFYIFFLHVRFFLTVFLTVFFCTFWSWGFLGIPLDPKTCKNVRFFKVFEHAAFWLFEAPDGSLGSSLPILAKTASDLWSRKCCKTGPSHLSKSIWLILQKNTKKRTILASFLEHFWEQFWGPFWDQIGQRGGKMSPREPSGVQRAKKLHFQKP